MNFVSAFHKGQEGGNRGLPMGPGLESVSKSINGIQQGRQFVIASAAKVGKSTFVNYAFVIQPYLYALEHNIEIEWIYYSLEMSRIAQEFDFAAHFIFHDHKMRNVRLPEGVTHKKRTTITISADYLLGKKLDDNDQMIKVDPKVEKLLIQVYMNRIIPLFGKFDEEGNQIQKGKIIFIKDADNPTGINKYLLAHAEQHGEILTSSVVSEGKTFTRNIGYIPKNPDKYTIIVTDHMRKLIPEGVDRSMKARVDKMSEYHCILRDLLGYTFVDIIHLNRSMSSIQRMKQFGDMLFPSSDDIKDTGNLAEDCDYLFTMFNPNDERYNLKKHFGQTIKKPSGDPLYPEMRTIHLVESRHSFFPAHFRVNMEGGIKNFTSLKLRKDE